MSGIENLKKRLEYRGGVSQENRLIQGKLTSLKKALHYSYQAATAILSDDREFKCLINPNKETGDYDNKILSIPYFDKCLNPAVSKEKKNSDGTEATKIKSGDVITWKETNTHWIIFLQYLEEDAYFRGQIRECRQQVEIGNKKYWVYIRGPVETSIPWRQKGGIEWNDINHSLVMYVSRDENTVASLKRFSKIKVEEPLTGDLKTWQVAGVNPFYGDGIVSVYLDEFFENPIQEAVEKENQLKEEKESEIIEDTSINYPFINGPKLVDAYSTHLVYTIEGAESGEWFVENDGKKVSYGKEKSIMLDIAMSKGIFTISYETVSDIYKLEVKVLAF